MESLTGFVVAAALLLQYTGRERLSNLAFATGIASSLLLLVLHTTDKLPLNF